MRKNMMRTAAIALAAAMLAGCGGNGTNQTTAATTAAATTAAATTAAAGGTETTAANLEETSAAADANEISYPLVDEPVTLRIGYQADSAYGPYANMSWFQELSEVSGITFEFVEYADSNAVGLMFASRDYPDILLNGGSEKQFADAIEAGDVVPLDDLIEQYAPNWANYFKDNPDRKASVTYSDGHIYSLPQAWEDPVARLRDVWWINEKWLKELGLEVPTTTDEFYEALKAFKEHAGEGSIPEDVIPYYTRPVAEHIGGALDVINSFGVRVVNENYRVTVDDDGKVEFNYANEAIKEPIKYLHKLLEEGLLSKDGLTDDYTTYLSKTTGSTTEQVGSWHSYLPNTNTYTEVGMGPLDSGNGKTPFIRSQTTSFNKKAFNIFKTCKYPEVAVKLANMIADEHWSVYCYRVNIVYNDDGTYTVLDKAPEGQPVLKTPNTYIATLITKETASKIDYSQCGVGKRAAVINERYMDYLIDKENLYPPFFMSSGNVDRLSELRTDIWNCVNKNLNNWVLNGGVDEGWDAYISQLQSYGLEEYLNLLQEELENYQSHLN